MSQRLIIYLAGRSDTSITSFWPDLGSEGWLLGMTGYISCFSVSASVQGAIILIYQLPLTAVLGFMCVSFLTQSIHSCSTTGCFFSLSVPLTYQMTKLLRSKENVVRDQHEFQLLYCCAIIFRKCCTWKQTV